MRRRQLLAALAGTSGGLAGCGTLPTQRRDDGDDVIADEMVTVADGPLEAAPPAGTGRRLGYTHHRADGNRYARGRGSLPGGDPAVVSLDGTPAWLVGAATATGSLWVVALRTGRTRAIVVRNGAVSGPLDALADLPAGTPPLLSVDGRGPRLLALPDDASDLTHPVPVGPRRAVVADDGALAIRDDGGVRARFPVAALPDARILLCGQSENARETRGLVAAGATDRYAHGALGDDLESGRLALFDPGAIADGTSPDGDGEAGSDAGGDPRLVREIPIPDDAVFEGIAPIWTDWSGDRTIVVTETDGRDGARLVAYAEDGRRLAAGSPIGTGFRWRHQLAVAPFADERELAVVRTPHIGGRVEFYRRTGDGLAIAATLDGYSSHALGSRNLDMALAADADGDGRVELVVPTDDRTRLGGIRREGNSARAAWHVDLGETLSTNLAAVEAGGRVAVGAGTTDGTVRLWLP